MAKGGKSRGGAGEENSKKAAGNSKKAAAAARKQSELDAVAASVEDEYWSKGAKNTNAKKEAEAAKKAEAAQKKAEREAELEAEMAAASKKKPVIKQKKGGIDGALSNLYAHNIDDAISALEITSGKSGEKVDRHPERRFKPALNKYEEARLPELRKERQGLRLNQYKQIMYEEFQKSPENPFNQVKVAFNASQDEVEGVRSSRMADKESKLIR